MVVADAGPLISFARAGQETILRQLFPQIIIPEAVYTEIVCGETERPGSALVRDSAWIRQVPVQDRFKVEQLPANLGFGEKEAIILAEERGAFLLVDDRTARREAERRSIAYFGSLRVLKEAKERGIINDVRSIVDTLRNAGLRLSDTLYQAFLQEIGE